MTFHRFWRWAVSALAAATLTLGVSDISGAAPRMLRPSVAAAGTITYAEAPGAAPNWIFPYTGYLNFSAANINEFQQLMYRPLYYFGQGASVAYDPALSLASAPVLSDGNRIVTIHLKGWRFADGQLVNASSVLFFLNLYHADPTGYGGYTPGVGIPDELAGASASGLTVVLHMKSAVNSNWFLYNYLSQITPLADRWDMVSAHAAGRCATGTYGAAATDASCKSVEAYLDKMASATGTFTSAFWQSGDDGPWRLSAFDAAGNATFQPNAHYTGPQVAQERYLKEVAYTSEAAEVGDLESGKINIGYVDPTDLLAGAPKSGSPGPNLPALNAKYRLSVIQPYGFDFADLNFASTNPLQAEFQQLYVRQALQEAINEPSIVRGVYDNYATATFSPLPASAAAALSTTPKSSYSFNLAAAKALLTSHGWSEVNDIMTCMNAGSGAGHCGANVQAGASLSFTLLYLTGSPTIDATVNALVAGWQSIGVAVTATATTFNLLASECTATSTTLWSMCWTGQNWTYQPNLYPSGEQTFLQGASANWGGYSDTEMNALLAAAMSGKSTLSAYEQYAANQLPVLYLPTPETLVETSRSLKSSAGWTTNGLSDLLPEYLHY